MIIPDFHENFLYVCTICARAVSDHIWTDQEEERRHMGKCVGVLLGNRVHRHSCGDENAGLWIQWVYIQPSSPSVLWAQSMDREQSVIIKSAQIDHV